MSSKRCDRTARFVEPIELNFYHGSIDIHNIHTAGRWFKVEDVKDIKNHIAHFKSFNRNKDMASLFLLKKDSHKFAKGLPVYVKVKYV